MDFRPTSRRGFEPDSSPPTTPRLQRTTVAARPLFLRGQELASKPAAASDAVRELARPSQESQLRARLDRFYSEMRAPYQVDGREVSVTPHFASRHGDDAGTRQRAALAKIRTLVGPAKFPAIAMKAASATGTRGSASDIHQTVQAMIDAGGLKPYGSMPPEQAIRRMMWDRHIGLDCRGYTGRAFLYSRGVGSAPAAASRFGLEPSEFLVQHNAAFRKVSVAQARAGDWIRLEPDKNGRDHNVIVRSNTTHSFGGSGLTVSGKQVPRAFAEDGWPPGSTPSVRVLEVVSSWGGGERGDHGGVERQAWIHNEKSGLWGYWRGGELQISAGPYAHSLNGVYRPRREP